MFSHFSGRTALVTGASRGFGRALALEMARSGARIIALARTQGALTALDDDIKKETGSSATLIPFDLAGPEQAFASLGQTLFERFGKLDFLVLNAATIGPLSPVSHTQEKDWQKVMDTNLTSNIRLLRVLDPMLKEAGTPHVTFVTCGDASMGNAYWGSYAASKKALEEVALNYEQETQNSGYRMRVFDPGVMATQLRRNAFPGEDQSKLPKPEDIAKAISGSADLWGS
jgi:NAD(P)-dependent dehydrogenase (short-subunit alcohol dehydrogenase family)